MSVPYLPLYVADYEADTAHLSIEEDGAYTRLLRLCWRTPGCSVPNDPEWLMRRLRASPEEFERVVKPIIAEFFILSKARLSNRRLSAELERIEGVSKKRSNAGRKGGRKAQPIENTKNDTKPGLSKEVSKTKANGKHLDLDLEPEERAEPNGSGAEAPPEDIRKALWSDGLASLRRQTGLTDDKARKLVGKWLKSAGENASKVLTEIKQAEADGRDAIPWIEATLKTGRGVTLEQLFARG